MPPGARPQTAAILQNLSIRSPRFIALPMMEDQCIGIQMKPRCWLLFGPLLFCILDGGLTLQGQSHEYWEGRFDQAEEMNPLGLWPLRQGPDMFLIALFCWITTFGFAIFLLPENLAR